MEEILPGNEAVLSLKNILTTATELAAGRYGIRFDLSLVRGQGYYTGTVFEVESNEFRGAIAGGGRYDNLSAAGFEIPGSKPRIALYCSESDLLGAAKKAEELREKYIVSLLERPKKLGKALSRMEERGYAGYLVYGEGDEIKLFTEK